MEQKDWIILAVVCGVIAMVYMQQQKPVRVKENYTDSNEMLKDMYAKGSDWMSGYVLPRVKENYTNSNEMLQDMYTKGSDWMNGYVLPKY